ncbi:MAG: carboxypeptidase-like regulatory domain-containing protein [Elusimicrobiota bacterium]
MTRWIMLAVLGSLVACVPTLSRRSYTPLISGTLVRDGKPVVDAEIVLTAAFTDARASAKTDSEGRFHVGPLSERQFMRRVFGDRIFIYKIGINIVGEQGYTAFEGRSLGYLPDSIQLACDLTHPSRQGKSLSYCSRNE